MLEVDHSSLSYRNTTIDIYIYLEQEEGTPCETNDK